MTVLPFAQEFPISQTYGQNVDTYRRFGLARGHNGTDFAVVGGTPLYAPDGGVVTLGNDPPGYGHYVEIDVPDGPHAGQWLLAHMQSFAVSDGQTVSEGQLLGYSDNTGFSTGPHLHLGFRPLGYDRNDGMYGWVDPLPYLGGGAVIGHPPEPTSITYNPDVPPDTTFQPDADTSVPAAPFSTPWFATGSGHTLTVLGIASAAALVLVSTRRR